MEKGENVGDEFVAAIDAHRTPSFYAFAVELDSYPEERGARANAAQLLGNLQDALKNENFMAAHILMSYVADPDHCNCAHKQLSPMQSWIHRNHVKFNNLVLEITWAYGHGDRIQNYVFVQSWTEAQHSSNC